MYLYEYEDEEIPSEICGDFERYNLIRFIFLAFTSLIAFLGTFGNLLLIYIFSTRKYPNTPPTLYPTVLAFLDTSLCALYIMLFGVDAAIVYLHVKSLFVLYHIYIVPAYVVSRITQLAIPYMLILGTLERFVWISGRHNNNSILRCIFSNYGRHITMCITLVTCVVLRLPTAFATVVHEFPNCTDFFRSKSTGPADWVLDNDAYYFFDFHLLSIAQTVVPFFVLVVFNLVIVRKLTEGEPASSDEIARSNVVRNNTDNAVSDNNNIDAQNCLNSAPSPFRLVQRVSTRGSIGASLSSFRRLNSNRAVRSAIYTMMAIVTTYLVSNSLHLILTILERSKSSLLRDPKDPNLASTFHTIFSDIVSFVYMFTSAIRLIVYYICNPTIRGDIQQFFSLHSRNTRKFVSLSTAV